MQINRVKFRGFGRWVNKEFQFREGINVIEAPNEAGKSTIIQGIFSLLYGPKKEGVKKQIKADWYQQYLPWMNSDYGGEIEYSVQNHPYRLVRTLLLPHDKAQLNDLAMGLDISDRFSMDAKKDRLFLEEQIGFSHDSMKRIAYLSPRFVDEGKEEHNKQSQVIERIKTALYGQDLDVQPVLKQLEKKINEIGHPKSDTKKLGIATTRCNELEKEVHRLKSDYVVLVEDIQYCSELKKKIEGLVAEREELGRERGRIYRFQQNQKLQEAHLKIQNLRHQYEILDQFNEEEAYRAINKLEEFSRLEKRNLALYDYEGDAVNRHRLEADIADIILFQEQEKTVEIKKREVDQQALLYSGKKTIFINGWLITSLLSLLGMVIAFMWMPSIVVLPALVACFSSYNYYRLLVSGTQCDREVLAKEGEQLARELERVSVLKKAVFDYWSTDSLAVLYAKLNEMRRVQSVEVEDPIELGQNEQKMEQIHQDVKRWITTFLCELPPFDSEQWIREIRLLIHQAKEYREEMYKLKLLKAEINKEAITTNVEERIQHFSLDEIRNIEDAYNRVERELLEKKEEHAKLEGKIEKMCELVSVLPLKETEWEIGRAEVAELERERKAYELAKEVLQEAVLELQENIGPKLIPVASKWLKMVSDNRYDTLLINLHRGVHLNVFVPETGENQPICMLSKGAVDQVIFALRLSLLQFYANHTSLFLPLILDDYFVHFDEVRIQNALRLLDTFAIMGHQVILCTCHKRESSVLDRLGIEYYPIHLR